MGRPPQQQQQHRIQSPLSGRGSSNNVERDNGERKNRVVILVVGIAIIVLVGSFFDSHPIESPSSSSSSSSSLVQVTTDSSVSSTKTVDTRTPNQAVSTMSPPTKSYPPVSLRLSLAESIPWPGKPLYELNTQDGNLNRVIRIGPDRGPIENTRAFFEEHLTEFLQFYARRPDPANACGGRLNHQFALFTIVKQLQPTTIIESGVYAGQSTYMFRQAAGTQTKIISIDPHTQPVCYNPPSYMPNPTNLPRWIDHTNNEYLTGSDFVDFSQVNWTERIAQNELDPATTLIFMDDHQGFYPRRFDTFLQHGFRYVVFDDNLKLGYGTVQGDAYGDTPKQMWRKPNDDATQWLFHQALIRYAEFPPLLSPRLTEYTGWKKEPGFLYHTDDFRHFEEPLLQPEFKDRQLQDLPLLQTILQSLDIPDLYRDNRMDYFELFQYSWICFLELNPQASQPPPPL